MPAQGARFLLCTHPARVFRLTTEVSLVCRQQRAAGGAGCQGGRALLPRKGEQVLGGCGGRWAVAHPS